MCDTVIARWQGRPRDADADAFVRGEERMRTRDYIAVRRAFNVVRQDVPREGRLTFEAMAILCLLDYLNAPVCVSDIADHQQCSAPTLSHRLNSLESLGYIVRSANDGDRRSVTCATTPAGREVERACCEECHVVLVRSGTLAHVGPERLRVYLVAMGRRRFSAGDQLLVYLGAAGGQALRASEMMRGTGLLQPTVSMALDTLEGRGLVERPPEGVLLTEEGARAADALGAEVEGMVLPRRCCP